MSIRSVLVVSDLSPQENAAVEKACRLAQTHNARLKLMYVPAPGQQASPAAPARLADLARQLEARLEAPVKTASGKSVTLDDIVGEARGIDLVVLPHRHERSTAAFFRGQPVVRLLRRLTKPVLVVRPKDLQYERILVGVDFTPASQTVVQLAAAFAPGAQLQLFHAVNALDEAKLRSAEASEEALRAYRAKCRRQAEANMLSLADSFAVRRNRVLATLGRGDPGAQIVVQQEHSGAELVVVGKKRTAAWEDFLCGSVAHRVLSWGSSDVLVIPEAYVAGSAALAMKRIGRPRAGKRPDALAS